MASLRRQCLPPEEPSTGAWGAPLPKDAVSLDLRGITETDWALLSEHLPTWDATKHALAPEASQLARDPREPLEESLAGLTPRLEGADSDGALAPRPTYPSPRFS